MTPWRACSRTADMSAAAALVPYRDARDFVLSRIPTISPMTLPLGRALGKPLAGPVVAAAPIPPGPLAARRGIAVSSRELVGASAFAPALLTAPPSSVLPGDPLPYPADAVIETMAVTHLHGMHAVGQSVYPGEGGVLPGTDYPQGAEIAPAGATVTPTIQLAMALAGCAEVSVLSPLIHLDNTDGVAVAETDWLRAALEAAGCSLGSVGDSDLRVLVARDVGATSSSFGRTAIPGIALNPGRDTLVLWDGARLTIVLAARFDAVVAGFHALIAPALAGISGRKQRLIEKPLTDKLVSQVGMAEICLLRDAPAGYRPLATGRLSLEALIKADAAGIVAPESEGAPAGAGFSAVPLQNGYERS
jgi:molybdopterin molybdotransferase